MLIPLFPLAMVSHPLAKWKALTVNCRFTQICDEVVRILAHGKIQLNRDGRPSRLIGVVQNSTDRIRAELGTRCEATNKVCFRATFTVPLPTYLRSSHTRARCLQWRTAMKWIGWDDKYATGHAGMDHGHKKLMGLINQLAEGMENDAPKESCCNTLAQFIEQASIHFAHEEQLMDSVQYPRASEHKTVHANMLSDVQAFKVSYDASDTTEFITLLVVLDSWLKRDIEAEDKALVTFVNSSSRSTVP